MSSPLFVITTTVDCKLINRLLLHLRDWEYGEDPTWDNFTLITTAILPEADNASIPPITESDLANNIWANQTISDIESFMLNKPYAIFLVLDEQGAKDGTIILLELADSDENEGKPKKFNKVRVPWERAYIMYCNLEIANMGFDEFVEEQEGDEVEWWKYKDDQDDELPEEIKEKRHNAITELEQKGMA